MNTESTPVRMAMIGCGGMARHHVRRILQQQNTTQIAAICEPSEEAYEAFCQVFAEAGAPPPPNAPDLDKLLREYEGRLARPLSSRRTLHHDQARACMEAGVDAVGEAVVMNGGGFGPDRDARPHRPVAGRLFNGSLSRRSARRRKCCTAGVGRHPQHQRNGMAERNPDHGQMAAGPGDVGRRLHVRHGRTCSIMRSTWRARILWRWRRLDNRGARSTSGRSWRDGVGRWRRSTAAAIRCALARRMCAPSARKAFYAQACGASGCRCSAGQDARLVRTPPSLGQWQQFLKVRGEIANPCPGRPAHGAVVDAICAGGGGRTPGVTDLATA